MFRRVFRCYPERKGKRKVARMELTWMAKQLTPPVPWVRTVMPFLSGMDPKNRAFIAVLPATDKAAISP